MMEGLERSSYQRLRNVLTQAIDVHKLPDDAKARILADLERMEAMTTCPNCGGSSEGHGGRSTGRLRRRCRAGCGTFTVGPAPPKPEQLTALQALEALLRLGRPVTVHPPRRGRPYIVRGGCGPYTLATASTLPVALVAAAVEADGRSR